VPRNRTRPPKAHGGDPADRRRRAAGWIVLAGAAAVAVASAHDYAGGWNDGSRLATVESLVDHHTLAIDRSIFSGIDLQGRHPTYEDLKDSPYHPEYPLMGLFGTLDKIHVDGRFYSHKSPVPALLLAGWYAIWQALTGMTAKSNPHAFCYWMTLGSSGLSYVVAVLSVFQLGRVIDVPLRIRLGLTAGFGLATVALPYTRFVNDHILLLAVAALLALNLARLARGWIGQPAPPARLPWARVAWAGCLAGLAYTIDLGTGPVLLLCTAAVIGYRLRRAAGLALAVFSLGALPWLALHHAVNWQIGGTFTPAASVPEYFTWPGSPFTAENMTGVWNHDSIGGFLWYAASLLVGIDDSEGLFYRGFFGHNLPVLLALPGVAVALRRRPAELPEVLWAAAWCLGTWLLYSLLSNNYSGTCCSIRWFVPLVAAAYYIVAVLVRESPQYRLDLAVLTGVGLLVGASMWSVGPWTPEEVPWIWHLQAIGLGGWLLCILPRLRRRPIEKAAAAPEAKPKRRR
jgi:hypothetical protein